MDLDLLTYADRTPAGADTALWVRWLKGTRAFDEEYTTGARCPTTKEAPCRCTVPKQKICQIWRRLEELAPQVGQGEIIQRIR